MSTIDEIGELERDCFIFDLSSIPELKECINIFMDYWDSGEIPSLDAAKEMYTKAFNNIEIHENLDEAYLPLFEELLNLSEEKNDNIIELTDQENNILSRINKVYHTYDEKLFKDLYTHLYFLWKHDIYLPKTELLKRINSILEHFTDLDINIIREELK